MKALKKDLQSVVKDLKALALKAEKLTKKLDKLGPAEAAKPKRGRGRPPATPVKKPAVKAVRGSSAMDMVFGIISKTKKGVDTTKIKEKTKRYGMPSIDSRIRVKSRVRAKEYT